MFRGRFLIEQNFFQVYVLFNINFDILNKLFYKEKMIVMFDNQIPKKVKNNSFLFIISNNTIYIKRLKTMELL